ncbi:hypothetical protein GBAR_LOCUS26077 [Geodia barretti]|uniref:DED domain-containing protein n=1 Tax=Geodia barretti TaxID=519541 RepID=A0AA35THR6_GEOBA|nr:hypothetical protein GBAR_LOCUS26077 [Geodia barretti]
MATRRLSWQNRASEFRKLICRLSESLTERNDGQIKYIRQLTAEKARSSLDMLTELEERGEFSPYNTEPLVKLLQEINRHDLAQEVRGTYQTTYPDVTQHSAGATAAEDTKPDPKEDNLSQLDRSRFDRSNVGQLSWPLLLHKQNTQHMRSGSVTVFIPPSPSLPLGVRFGSSGSSLGRSGTIRRSGTYSIHSVVSEHPSQASLQLELVSQKASDRPSGLVMIPIEQHPSQAMQLSSHDHSLKRRGFYNWKPKITWKGKKDGGSYQEFTDRQKRITKYLWNIESRDLLSTICHKRYLQRINCPQNITVDIKCGEDNPHVFLCLYPHGLFDDAEKSMTLQFKVIIPNNCPPIPTKATFILSWEMLAKHENESFTKVRISEAIDASEVQNRDGLCTKISSPFPTSETAL